MNIAIADGQPLNINRPDSAPVTEPGDGGFSELMGQHMSQDVASKTQDESLQVIDIKELLLHQGEVAGTESDLSIDQGSNIMPTVIVEPVAVDFIEAEIPVQPENLAEPGEILALAINPAIGDSLPVDGKTLPPVELQARVAPQAAASVMSTQGDSTRQQRAVPPHLSQVEASEFENNLSRSTELVGLGKTEAPIETINFSKMNDFQIAKNIASDFVDNSLNQIRTLTPFNASLGTQTSGMQLPPQPETLTLINPRDTGAWSGGLGERINWMVNQKLNTATIRMDPPMLGRLDVHIQVTDDATNVTINTQHAQTRDMIDNASSRLREFLQENGYQNVNVDVSHQQEQRQQASEHTDDTGSAGNDSLLEQESANANPAVGNQYFSSDSMVDYFA